MSVTLELRMTLKLLHSVEGLVKATRNCGPFGGVSIESVSIPSVIKKAEELAEYQFKKLPKAEEVTSLAKVIKVSFEDKFEKSKRIQVEEYRVELVRIPEDLNGFEYLCHPHLEKEEHLVGYFKAWHNTTLMSLYYLIHNSPLVMYFLSPTTSNEQEVSYQLRKRYNLIVETEEASIENSPKEIEKMKEEKMNLVINTRHDIKRILIKLKIYQMKDFSSIIQELESHKREFMMTTHAESKGKVQNRARFFSDELPEQAIIRRRERMKAEEAAVYKYSMDTTTNPVNNSLDLMASNRSGASRPFKLQEGILEERAVQSKRRMSLALSLVDSSLTNMYRKSRICLTKIVSTTSRI